MISLDQVQLLETRVGNAIDILKRVKAENASLVQEKNGLLSKLEANQKRLDELEVLVMRFKEDQGRIEDGIIAALDRLSQFEEAFESGLKDTPLKKSQVKKSQSENSAQETKKTENKNAESKIAENKNAKEFFEITEEEKVEADLSDDFSLDNDNEDEDEDEEVSTATRKKPTSGEAADGELDIF